MFARMLEFNIKMEKKNEFVTTVKTEVLPILKKQAGFLEILPFFGEIKPEKVTVISLWETKANATKYEKETYYKVEEILKPWLLTPITTTPYNLEKTLAEHFVQSFV